jgi:ornithine cyclodeaminase/alanine dehydrogenase-like protein (mu-crystallin family)
MSAPVFLGRESGDEIIVFDSTGIGLQDVAAAIAALLRSRDRAHAAGGQVGLPAGGDPAIEHP